MSTERDYSDKELRWLLDITDNAERATSYIDGASFDSYQQNDMVRSATERAIARASEAAYRLGPRGERLVPMEDWSKLRGIGNVLRHEYHRVADDIVYEVATVHLPRMRAAVIALLQDDYQPFDPEAFDPNAVPARRIKDPS